MRSSLISLVVLAFCAFPECASGQTALPWGTAEGQIPSESQGVSESELPLVRARLEANAEVWVEQAVGLNVEVIVPTWFTGAPEFPQLEVKNAVTLGPEAAVNFVVQSGGKSFSAQSVRYLICPQSAGRYAVQCSKIGVAYALPDGRPSQPRLLAPPQVQFEARLPPGAEGAGYFFTTTSFQINQSFDREPQGLKVGDSVRRTITMTAEDTLGMILPPLMFQAPEGVRLYPGMPNVTDPAERGANQATRIETAVYIMEKEGRYSIPEIMVLWWNPLTKTMNRASLPSIELNVRADSGMNPELFASNQADEGPSGEARFAPRKLLKSALRWLLPLLAASVIVLVLRWLLHLKGRSLQAYLARRRTQRAEEEAAYFRRFQKASLLGDPQASLRNLMFWLDRATTGYSTPTLTQFVMESGMPELAKETKELNAALFDREMNADRIRSRKRWSGKSFYKLVATAGRLKKNRSHPHHGKAPLLGKIN
jgi:hypothetical protein